MTKLLQRQRNLVADTLEQHQHFDKSRAVPSHCCECGWEGDAEDIDGGTYGAWCRHIAEVLVP